MLMTVPYQDPEWSPASQALPQALGPSLAELLKTLKPTRGATTSILPADLWEPLLAALPRKPKGTELMHIRAPEGHFWLVHFTSTSAPRDVTPGLYWIHKPADGGDLGFERIYECPVTPEAGLRQLETLAKVSNLNAHLAVNLGLPVAQHYKHLKLLDMPLNLRIRQEPLYSRFKERSVSKCAAAGIPTAGPSAFKMRETAAVRVVFSPKLLAKLPVGAAEKLYLEVLNCFKPLSALDMLENIIPPGRGVHVGPPPGWTRADLNTWATCLRAKLPPKTEDPAGYRRLVEPVEPVPFEREAHLVGSNGDGIFAINRVDVKGWLDPAGVGSWVSWRRDGLMLPETSDEDRQFFYNVTSDVAAIRVCQMVEGLHKLSSSFLNEEGAATMTGWLRAPVWDQTRGGFGNLQGVIKTVGSCCDEFGQTGPDSWEGVAGNVILRYHVSA